MSSVLNLQSGQRVNVVAAYGEVIYSGTFIRIDPESEFLAIVEIDGSEEFIPIANLEPMDA